jgi:integrase
LRHTFATWLEDEGIPARVIDEVMGHRGGRHEQHGSAIGRHHRHTTDAMRERVREAVDDRLAVALKQAECVVAQRRTDEHRGTAAG